MARKPRTNKLYTLDTETIGLDGSIKRIAVYDGNEITYGYNFNDIEWIFNKAYEQGINPHIYIHNAEFDLRKMPQIFELGNVIWDSTKVINGRYILLTCQRYTIHDSFRLLPASLDSLSKSFDLKHGKMDLWKAVQDAYPGQYSDKVDFFNRCDKDDPVYIEYLGYDVISLYELIEKLLDISGIAFDDLVKCLTTASMSKYVLKNGYKGIQFMEPGAEKTDFEILQSCRAWKSTKTMKRCNVTYLDVENKIREAYCGGRTEVFIPHAQPRNDEVIAHHYDVNSLYPAVMSPPEDYPGSIYGSGFFPVGYPQFYDNEKIIAAHFRKYLETRRGWGFIKADVFVPQQKIPPLPIKRGKLVFVTGYITGTWTYEELAYAIDHCGVRVEKYLEQIHFSKGYPVFKNFINLFAPMKTEAKKNGQKALTYFCKLMCNTNYGITGMRRDNKTELKDISKKEKYQDRLVYSNEKLGFIEIKSDVKSYTIQVQIAAYVTSRARIVLLDALRRQSEIGQVYYCDTDSIVCEKPMPKEMVDSSKLGFWDKEGELYEGIFVLPKVYTERKVGEEDTIKFKGVSRDKQSELNFEFYSDLFDRYKAGEHGRLVIEENKEMLRGLLYSQKNDRDANLLEIRSKALNVGTKGKRQFDFAKNDSQPWHFGSLKDFNNFDFNGESSFKRQPDGQLFNLTE